MQKNFKLFACKSYLSDTTTTLYNYVIVILCYLLPFQLQGWMQPTYLYLILESQKSIAYIHEWSCIKVTLVSLCNIRPSAIESLTNIGQ